MAVPRQLWSLLWRMPMQPWNEGKQSAVRDTLGGADWTELKNSWITLFMWGDHANVCKCMVNLQDFTLKNVFFGLVMDPCWNIYVDFWARSSRLVFNESVCEIFNIYQYFAVLQKWPNRCLPQKVVGVLGPEFQSSQFFFGRYFLSTPPPTTNHPPSLDHPIRWCFMRWHRSLANSFGATLHRGIFEASNGWKGLGFKNGPKQWHLKLSKHSNFKSSVQNDLEQRDLVTSSVRNAGSNASVFVPFWDTASRWRPHDFSRVVDTSRKKGSNNCEPRQSVHNLGGPVFLYHYHQHALWKLNPSKHVFFCNPSKTWKQKTQVKSIQWCLCKNNVYGDIWRENLVKRKM